MGRLNYKIEEDGDTYEPIGNVCFENAVNAQLPRKKKRKIRCFEHQNQVVRTSSILANIQGCFIRTLN